jgi:hypothetical protein
MARGVNTLSHRAVLVFTSWGSASFGSRNAPHANPVCQLRLPIGQARLWKAGFSVLGFWLRLQACSD